MPALYFVIGNIPVKFRFCLNDIKLLTLSPVSLLKNYGYAEILDRACRNTIFLFDSRCYLCTEVSSLQESLS